jgi:hypothetical protein
VHLRDRLTLELLSVADLVPASERRSIGHALDADLDLRPERMGLRDPAREKIDSAAEHLAAWEPARRRGKRDEQFLLRSTEPDAGGSLMLSFEPWPRTLFIGFDAAWFSSAERLERFARWFARLADAMHAFHGMAAFSPILRQEQNFKQAARQAGTVTFDRSQQPYFVEERAIRDVYWLNYFGPATVEMWGEHRLDAIGGRQERTSSGGHLAWATETPFVHDVGATKSTDYAWKQPFYDAIGLDTFLHEQWQDPGAGQRVPTLEKHRQATGSAADSATG